MVERAKPRRVKGNGEASNSPLPDGPHFKLMAASNPGAGGPFDLLAKRYQAALFSVAFQITRNRADAEDVVRQTSRRRFCS